MRLCRQKKWQVNLSELVHLRQIIKMIYKKIVNISHLCTQQMVTTDDTKPIISWGQRESTTLHSILYRAMMKKIRNLGPQTDSATKRLWLGDLGQVFPSLGKMTSDFPCGSNVH